MSARPNSTWAAILLLAILLIAAGLRLYDLVPPERGLLFAADTDEGIYAASARLLLDGHIPYRDYFCSAPPVALYLFSAILAPLSQPWGGEASFMALRYASVLYGMITLLAAYAIGARLGGRGAGLLSAALLAVDGWVVGQDRRAMLEAPLNMFSALAILAIVEAARRPRGDLRLYALSGVLAACAMLSKTQGAVVLVAVIATVLLQTRWRAAAMVAASAMVTYAALSLPFLLVAGDDFVRQLFAFQFLRPPNGDPRLILRINAIRNYAESWLTVRLGLLGGAAMLARWMWAIIRRGAGAGAAAQPAGGRPEAEDRITAWLPVGLWAVIVAVSFAMSKTYYLYYYAQLAVPLALLGGSLLHPWGGHSRTNDRRTVHPALATLVVLALLTALAALRLPAQLQATLARVEWVKPAYVDIGRALADTPAESRVLVFEPNYAFLGSRATAPAAGGVYLIDIHAYMLYVNLDIKAKGWSDLARDVALRRQDDEQRLLWRQPAQEMVLGAFERADYVVVDDRARYLLAPETLAALESGSGVVTSSLDATLRRR